MMDLGDGRWQIGDYIATSLDEAMQYAADNFDNKFEQTTHGYIS